MLNTIYGIDVKLPPEGPPKLIEINGVDFGTDFYKMQDHGRAYYDRAAKALGNAAKGKPLLLESDWCPPRKQREVQHTAQVPAKPVKDALRHRLIGFENRWLDLYAQDNSAFESVSRSDGYPPEPTFYYEAAKRQGIDAHLFVKARRESDGYEFDTVDRRKAVTAVKYVATIDGKSESSSLKSANDLWDMCVHIRHLNTAEIGAVWPMSTSLHELTGTLAKPHPKFFNSPTLEFVLDHKAALYACVDKAGWLSVCSKQGWYGPSYPRTYVHALGISDPAALSEFIHELPGRLVVIKPADGHCGIGTRILTKHALLAEIGRARRRRQAMNLSEAVDYCYIAQEFVPSKPVRAKHDGKMHDGCIRAAVINGKYIGSQWRLAPKPMNARADYVSRYRCNLSRGAFPQYLADKDEEVVARFAEDSIAAFERVIMPAVKAPFDHIELQLETPFDLSDTKTAAASRKRLEPWRYFIARATEKDKERIRKKMVEKVGSNVWV